MLTTHPMMVPARERRRRAPEAGLGLIEIIVVLLIILVLTAIAISTFRSTKRTTQFKSAQAAAATYAEAIEAYMQDNGQTPPPLGGAAWPTTPRAALIGGPRDAMLRNPDGSAKRYMPRAAPEAVSDGLVDFVRPGVAPSPAARATITYTMAGGTYTLHVRTVPVPGEAILQCVVTNAPSPPVQRCA